MTVTYVLSRSASLIQGILDGLWGYGNSAATATVVEATAQVTTLTDIAFSNPNASVVYLQIFDSATAGAVTLGSTSATYVYALAASTTGVFQVSTASDNGVQTALAIANGLAFAVTTASGGSSAAGKTTAVGFAYL